MKWVIAIFVFFASLAITALIAGQMQHAGMAEVYQYTVGLGIPFLLAICAFFDARKEESR